VGCELVRWFAAAEPSSLSPTLDLVNVDAVLKFRGAGFVSMGNDVS
jgi:hypothetical protein